MKAIIFIADGTEDVEAITVLDYLHRAGVDVKTVAVTNSSDIKNMVTFAHGTKVVADFFIDEYVASMGENLPDVVYTPGGMPGAANVGNCEAVISILKKCFSAKKIVAAICAAPVVVLARTGILCGKKYTCYPGMNEEMEKYGGEKNLTDGCSLVENVPFVLDDNLITGRGAGTAEQFAIALIEKLCGKETAQKVHDATLQR